LTLLSICIATYNRADYLVETLDSIVPQLADDVELLVVDGASTDNTEDLVNAYARNHPHIRYIRLPAKGGVDEDYNTAVERARGEYCWLFTDDDLMKSGAVDTVRTAITQGHDLVVVNAEVRDRQLAEILESQRVVIPTDRVYEPHEMERLFVDAFRYLSFIGGVVIRRQIWMARKPQSFFGTEFVHLGVIFQAPLLSAAMVIAEPYIIIRWGNAQWIPRSFDVWMFNWPNLVWSFDHISDHAKRSVSRREPWRSLRTLLTHRGLGGYSLVSYRQYVAPREVGRLWRGCAWLIACLPMNIALRITDSYLAAKAASRSFARAIRIGSPRATHNRA
jgi:glycosyltransferase involved in cell wall biosynthesis